jgi:hypothetical protein
MMDMVVTRRVNAGMGVGAKETSCWSNDKTRDRSPASRFTILRLIARFFLDCFEQRCRRFDAVAYVSPANRQKSIPDWGTFSR